VFRRAFAVSLISILSVSLLPVPAGAGTPAPDLWLYGRRTTIGQDVISASGVGERLSVSIEPGNERSITVAIRNRGSEEATFLLDATVSTDAFSTTFEADGNDVTDAVTSGAYAMTIRPGRHSYLSVRVAAAPDAQTGDAGEIRITGTPVNGAAADQVRILSSVPPIRVWGVNYTGTVRCEATFPLREVRPGYGTRVRFRVTNLTDHEVSVYGFGSLRFLDTSGNELWSTAPFWEGPVWATTLRPGHSKRMFAFDARVRWSGPLTVVPVCGALRVNMPRVVLPVTMPGAPASEADAIDAAVAVPGSPFQACPPGRTGGANTGTFSTPDGRALPPLTLRCWAEVTPENGFDVVSLQLVSPFDAPDFSIDPSTGFFGPELPGTDNMLASRWDFVVTADEVRPFLSRMQSRAMGEGRSYGYDLHRGEWTLGGWGSCGYWSYGASTDGEVFMLDWITGCTQTATPSSAIGGAWAGSAVDRIGRTAVVVRRPA
jgi:hypothetical protein